MYVQNFETLNTFIVAKRDNPCSATQVLKFGFYLMNLEGYIFIIDANSSWGIHFNLLPMQMLLFRML